MQEFRTSPESLAAALELRQRKALQYVGGLAVASSLVVIGWAVALERYQVLLLMPVMTVALAVIYRRNNKLQVARTAGKRYAIDDRSIALLGDGHPLRIGREEITSIEENAAGALIVKTSKLLRFLYIRPDVENRAHLRQALGSWMAITPRSDRWIELWPRVSLILAVALAPLTVTVALSQDPFVVVPAGIALLAIVGISIVTIFHQGGSITHKAAAFACSIPCIGLITKIVSVIR